MNEPMKDLSRLLLAPALAAVLLLACSPNRGRHSTTAYQPWHSAALL
jgi:hypothetical protein